MTGERGMDEMYLIPMQQQVQAARKELRECNEYSGRFGLALLGKDARSLRMGNAEQEELLYLLESKTLEQRRQLLRGAALKLCGELETGDAWNRGYVTAFAESLLPRLDAALWAGDVSNIFIAAKG